MTQKTKKEGGAKLAALIEKEPVQASIPTATPKDGITYSEEGAAERLGIPLDDFQWLRKALLDHGTDFTRESGIVRIKQAGITHLEEILKKGRTLIVTGTQIPNPQLVLAKIPGGQDVLRVRVADRDQWCRGMVIDLVEPTDNAKIWSTTIRPQFKGRA